MAYSYTPSWIIGIVNLIPGLPLRGIIVLVVSLYGIYLIYLGAPILMRVPSDKVIVYMVVCFVVALILTAVLGGILTGLVIGGGFAMM
jgi:hypothetical protein